MIIYQIIDITTFLNKKGRHMPTYNITVFLFIPHPTNDALGMRHYPEGQ